MSWRRCSPGTLERWGIGPDELHAINPRLVITRISGFGQFGPYARRPGFGTLAEAMSGFAAATGEPDGPPTLPPFGLADSVTAYAVMLALRARVVAARAAGLPPPAMSVYANVSDSDGLAASGRAGRRLGFLGRAAIHPRQLPAIVDAFRPSDQEVDRAQELLAAVAEAETHDCGTVVLPVGRILPRLREATDDGRFADRAMLAAAEQTLVVARRCGMTDRGEQGFSSHRFPTVACTGTLSIWQITGSLAEPRSATCAAGPGPRRSRRWRCCTPAGW